MDTEKYPIDFDVIEKGWSLSRQQMERLLGYKHTMTEFQTAALRLMKRCEYETTVRGKPNLVFSLKGSALHCLTDSEASVWTNKQIRSNLRRATKNHQKQLAVDVSNLTTQELAQHERNVTVDGMFIAAIAKVRVLSLSKPYRRDTPRVVEA